MSNLDIGSKANASVLWGFDNSTATSTPHSTRIVLPDIIRTLAIVLLITSHTASALSHPLGGAFIGIKGFYWVSLGGVAVTLFFILSGLALELKYGAAQIRYREFIIRRLLRIYPIYFLCLILGMLMYISEYRVIVLHWYDMLFSITGFYAFAGMWGGRFVATSWFIGPILFMYFVYPVLSRSMAKYNRTVILVVLLAITVAFRLLIGNDVLVLPGRPLDWFPLCRVFEFGLGIYIARALGDRAAFHFKFRRPVANDILATLGIISFPLFMVHSIFRTVITDLVRMGVSIPAAIIIYVVLVTFLAWGIAIIDRRIQSFLRPLKADLRPKQKAAKTTSELPSTTVVLSR